MEPCTRRTRRGAKTPDSRLRMTVKCHNPRSASRAAAYALLELLVTLAVIAVLISVLLPALTKSRRMAQRAACASNLRQVFVAMSLYGSTHGGWMWPVAIDDANGFPTNLGTNVSPDRRWPALMPAFNIRVPANTSYSSSFGTFAGDAYPAGLDEAALPVAFDAATYTPRILLCPADDSPVEHHSYVLNMSLTDHRVRFGTIRLGRAGNSAEVIVAGEKRTHVRDYFMNSRAAPTPGTEFDRIVESYRHGIAQGSNYLFMDGHVAQKLPLSVVGQLDPWELPSQ